MHPALAPNLQRCSHSVPQNRSMMPVAMKSDACITGARHDGNSRDMQLKFTPNSSLISCHIPKTPYSNKPLVHTAVYVLLSAINSALRPCLHPSSHALGLVM